jgi:hypothetical protein
MDDEKLEKASELKKEIDELAARREIFCKYDLDRCKGYDHATELTIKFYRPTGREASKSEAFITREMLPAAFDNCVDIIIGNIDRKLEKLRAEYEAL